MEAADQPPAGAMRPPPGPASAPAGGSVHPPLPLICCGAALGAPLAAALVACAWPCACAAARAAAEGRASGLPMPSWSLAASMLFTPRLPAPGAWRRSVRSALGRRASTRSGLMGSLRRCGPGRGGAATRHARTADGGWAGLSRRLALKQRAARRRGQRLCAATQRRMQPRSRQLTARRGARTGQAASRHTRAPGGEPKARAPQPAGRAAVQQASVPATTHLRAARRRQKGAQQRDARHDAAAGVTLPLAARERGVVRTREGGPKWRGPTRELRGNGGAARLGRAKLHDLWLRRRSGCWRCGVWRRVRSRAQRRAHCSARHAPPGAHVAAQARVIGSAVRACRVVGGGTGTSGGSLIARSTVVTRRRQQ